MKTNKKDDFYLEIKEVLYSINYVYYGLYFLIFSGIQLLHVSLISSQGGFFYFLYMAYAGLEAFIEVLLMAGISGWLLLHNFRKLHLFYLLITLSLLFARIIDFLLVRLMDLSVWQGIEYVLESTFSNFLEMLYATNIPEFVWIASAATILIFLFLGVALFFITDKICKRKEWFCSARKIFGLFAVVCSLIAFNDIFLHLEVDPKAANEYAKALPWKRTLLPRQENLLLIGGRLKTMPRGEMFLQEADSNLFSLERKPDLFLFIAESLRKDFMTEDVTPHLAAFQAQNASFPAALSIANATHISWFSTFYSLYPFYWNQYQPTHWQGGSPTLALLKKMGYEVRVYASSRLSFYNMDEILFGSNRQGVDMVREFQSDTKTSSAVADQEAIQALCRDISSSSQKGGRVFIVFLDSTHFDYSWPQDKKPLFTPVDDSINYLKMSYCRDNLIPLKNRYKNALHYVDELFYSVEETLREKNLWDDSVVVFTGDHGEEFNEHGRMFHASSLSSPQLQVPLYIKLGKDKEYFSLDASDSASQIDIFPTLFHYLLGENSASMFFQGTSLLSAVKRDHVIGARYNAGNSPCQFYIQSGPYRMIAEFSNRFDIFHSNTLKVCSIEDANGEDIPFSLSFVHTHFQKALDELFEGL